MLRKVRNYFFDEDAVATASDKAVVILMLVAGGLAIYSVAVSCSGMF